MKPFFQSFRAYLGGIAFGLGTLGLLLFAIGVPLSLFDAHFFTGLGYREGPQPAPEQLQASENHALHWLIWHRLAPLFVISLVLINYGFFEMHKEKKGEGELSED